MTKENIKSPKKVINVKKEDSDEGEFSFLYILPLVGGIGAAAIGGSGGSDASAITPITATPIAPVTPALPATSTNLILGGAISAVGRYNFNITPGDKNLPAWMQDDVGTDYIIKNIKDAGMNTVVLHFNYTHDPKTDTFFRPTFDLTDSGIGSPDWDTIEAGAIKVSSAGLKPVFYMTINQFPEHLGSLLSINYVPHDPDAFFTSYKEVVLKIAYLSEKYDSPYLAIGVELGPVATDIKYLPYWQDIIKSVREIYDGKLTYVSWVADPYDYNTELDDITFIDELDLLGITLFPQTLDEGQLDGTYEQFYAEWKNDIIPEFQKVIDALNKPVFIAELGVSRIDGAGSKGFWGSDIGMKLDFTEQAEVYDAMLRAIHEGLDIEGMIFWGGFDSTDLVNGTIDLNNSYTMNWIDVPAEPIITKWMYEFTNYYSFG